MLYTKPRVMFLTHIGDYVINGGVLSKQMGDPEWTFKKRVSKSYIGRRLR